MFKELENDVTEVLHPESATVDPDCMRFETIENVHTSRLTSSSSLAGGGFDASLGAGEPLVSRLSLSRLLRDSFVGVPMTLAESGLVIPDRGGAGTAPAPLPLPLATPFGPLEDDDQYPTPGFRERSMSCTDDWTLRISSRNVLLVWRS